MRLSRSFFHNSSTVASLCDSSPDKSRYRTSGFRSKDFVGDRLNVEWLELIDVPTLTALGPFRDRHFVSALLRNQGSPF